MRDPRSSRRYTELSADYIAARRHHVIECCLCHQPVTMSLPRTAPMGPTVEHRLPIRTIRATATSWPHAIQLCCDTTMWAIAHRRCQDRQGAHARNGKALRLPSRRW